MQDDFAWYELCTDNPEAAADFYSKVVGWTVRKSSVPGLDYTELWTEDRPVAGVMTLPPEEMPPFPLWFGYITVNDVDTKAAEVAAAGGNIYRGPEDIPKIGRFAVVTDPQNAVFMLFKPVGEPPPPLAMMQAGLVGWHELHSSDWQQGFAFYERMFGWSKDIAHEMGPIGTYQLFKASGLPIGGMLTDGQAHRPYWLYYFVVDDIDAGLQRVQKHGGTLLHGPNEVPGGAWVINAKDPQGGLFALVGMRKA